MKFNEIVLGENQDLIPEIIGGIQKIAIGLSQNNQSLLRRELVKQLNDEIPELNLIDGRIVNALIKEAYSQTHSPVLQNALSECFFENTGDKLVYNPNRISDANLSLTSTSDDILDLNKFDQKTEILNGAIELIGKTDAVADINETKLAIDKYVPKDNFSLTGMTKVKDTFNYAKRIYNGYGRLISQYEFAKQANLDLIDDFVFLRNELLNFRQEVTQLVTEIIGDNEKASHPDLFDFSEIEYFDIEEFRGKVNLAFDGFGEKLQIFNNDYHKEMLRLKDAGAGHVDDALNKLGKTQKRRGQISRREVKGEVAIAAIGFAFDAFLSISETRKNAEETVAQLKHDIEAMKLGLKEDAQIIAEDLLRLAKIHSRIKGVLIPAVKKFINEANIIYNLKLKDAYSKMVEEGTIAELSSENRRLAAERKQLISEIEDKNQGITICESEILRYEDLISEIHWEYNFVNANKPDIPIPFHNIISFGTAKTNYKKQLSDWERITEPIRTKYRVYVDNTNQEEETLLRFKDILRKLENRLKEIENQREENKLRIEEQRIRIEDFELQFEIFSKGIGQLSAASKNFLELGIAKDLIKKSVNFQNNLVGISDSETFSIPTVSDNNIDYLNDQYYQMKLKLELLSYTESLVNGEFLEKMAELGGEKKELFISDRMQKLRFQLSSKIQQKTKLDSAQTMKLVNLGTDIFVSILKTQKIKAKTTFLHELNEKLDHEFLGRFETLVASLKQSMEKDKQEAKKMESALNGAMSTEDLLKASKVLKNN
ncbi:hypothetical protein SAMN05660776_2883 [Salegentibacter holothuriorum]|uniref:Uncharacterized protein n=1 Tax=Salegentibacter holothuriorum TaxID=241145 RepID=A0A1T5DYB8_9FLAO|nr:hypothetical protein [Salegentibacter holothuriorum]SKB76852.1 hypothetical protein SAMN05660776_2883 [Salegentibacter holothuriorum]